MFLTTKIKKFVKKWWNWRESNPRPLTHPVNASFTSLVGLIQQPTAYQSCILYSVTSANRCCCSIMTSVQSIKLQLTLETANYAAIARLCSALSKSTMLSYSSRAAASNSSTVL